MVRKAQKVNFGEDFPDVAAGVFHNFESNCLNLTLMLGPKKHAHLGFGVFFDPQYDLRQCWLTGKDPILLGYIIL